MKRGPKKLAATNQHFLCLDELYDYVHEIEKRECLRSWAAALNWVIADHRKQNSCTTSVTKLGKPSRIM